MFTTSLYLLSYNNNFYRHPELHNDEIEAIQDMFEDAKQKGWLS
jgi:LAS superfamily LD-carboxypeptidase LdcB